jgi:hypothetical protein
MDPKELFEAIDREDIEGVIDFFAKVDVNDLEEAYELISNIYEHYVAQFGSEILNSEEYYKNLDYCRELYHSMLSRYGLSTENSLIHNKHQDFYEILLCKKNKKKTEAEIPGSVVIGGIEILSGALVWILPFPGTKQIGGIMIADGVRRTFNGLEEIDEENKQSQHPYYNS